MSGREAGLCCHHHPLSSEAAKEVAVVTPRKTRNGRVKDLRYLVRGFEVLGPGIAVSTFSNQPQLNEQMQSVYFTATPSKSEARSIL